MFSTEIITLFPNTSALLSDSLKDDINGLNEKVTNSAENRLDSSIDKTIQSISDSVYEGITETGDKLVENVNEKISEGITETGDNIKTQIVESSQSSKETLVNEVSEFDPFSFIKNIFKINGRKIGPDYPPFIITEIGINHEGSFTKAKKMIKDAHTAGAECVKFQYHITEEEMIKNDVVPGNTSESIWEIISRCSLTEEEEFKLKKYVDELDMIYLSTPFSRKAADKLEEMNVPAFKIGSGECNNYPLIRHIASFGKPIILSTGMNDINSISKSVQIFEDQELTYTLLHTTSVYPNT